MEEEDAKEKLEVVLEGSILEDALFGLSEMLAEKFEREFLK